MLSEKNDLMIAKKVDDPPPPEADDLPRFMYLLAAYAASDANSLPSGGTLLPRSQSLYSTHPIPKYPITLGSM